jgi:hypothetical protein
MMATTSIVAAIAMCAIATMVTTNAFAHGGTSNNYRSEVTSIEPKDLPIDVKVLDGDDRLRVENLGTEDLIIPGYQGEPYVRIAPGEGVYVNHNAPTYSENLDRYRGTVPESATKNADPNYKKIRTDPLFYTFHDHRIHWMSNSLPPGVDPQDPDEQKVFDWTVQVKYGDQNGTIHGRLTYIGGKEKAGLVTIAVTSAVILAMIALFIFDARKRKAHRKA